MYVWFFHYSQTKFTGHRYTGYFVRGQTPELMEPCGDDRSQRRLTYAVGGWGPFGSIKRSSFCFKAPLRLYFSVRDRQEV